MMPNMEFSMTPESTETNESLLLTAERYLVGIKE